LKIDGYQTEMFGIAGRPFEIVEQRPVQIAVHRYAFGETIANTCQRLIDKGDAACVVVGGDAMRSR
jgi:hypothetical protein